MDQPYSDSLDQKLITIQKVIDIETALKTKSNVNRYYKINKLFYTLFHSNQGLIHMAISRDGVYKPADLLEPARFIENQIRNTNTQNVLELACGRGGNLAYLAQKVPHVHFKGIDNSPDQLQWAYKKTQSFANSSVIQGDYHNLDQYEAQTFDIVFIIEALCYSEHPNQVFAEVHRVLKPDGFFIVFDGYARKPNDSLTEREKTAKQLIEIGMALPSLTVYQDFKQIGESAGFKITFEEDVSKFILPNLYKFEKLAHRFFKLGAIGKILARVLPTEFVYNALSGYLLPNAINDRFGMP